MFFGRRSEEAEAGKTKERPRLDLSPHVALAQKNACLSRKGKANSRAEFPQNQCRKGNSKL
jgi:hypothetical protein